MESSVKQRLREFIKQKNITVNYFEKSVGLSVGYVANISKSIQPDKIMRISQIYPELNTGWLLTGEGEMLRTDSRSVPDDDRNSLLATIASQQKTIERLTAMLDRLMMGDSAEGKKEQKVG